MPSYPGELRNNEVDINPSLLFQDQIKIPNKGIQLNSHSHLFKQKLPLNFEEEKSVSKETQTSDDTEFAIDYSNYIKIRELLGCQQG